MTTINWDDPCARLSELRAAKYRLISGQQESEFEYRQNDTTRRMRWSVADLTRLDEEIRKAEDECALVEGRASPTRRFAITGGSRRTL